MDYWQCNTKFCHPSSHREKKIDAWKFPVSRWASHEIKGYTENCKVYNQKYRVLTKQIRKNGSEDQRIKEKWLF